MTKHYVAPVRQNETGGWNDLLRPSRPTVNSYEGTFVSITRAPLFQTCNGPEIAKCPVVSLPEAERHSTGQRLTKPGWPTASWLKLVLVGQFEFLECTGENRLKTFETLREGRPATTSCANNQPNLSCPTRLWRRVHRVCCHVSGNGL